MISALSFKSIWKLTEAYPDRALRVEIDVALPPDADTLKDYELARYSSDA